jgi:hypothetical protein
MRATKVVKVVAIALLATTVIGFVTMTLWNWVTPAVFGWHAITFWQALGLLILSKILFGGLHKPGGAPWRRRMKERWEHMTPEEREQFRKHWGRRCGPGRGEEPGETQPAQ